MLQDGQKQRSLESSSTRSWKTLEFKYFFKALSNKLKISRLIIVQSRIKVYLTKMSRVKLGHRARWTYVQIHEKRSLLNSTIHMRGKVKSLIIIARFFSISLNFSYYSHSTIAMMQLQLVKQQENCNENSTQLLNGTMTGDTMPQKGRLWNKKVIRRTKVCHYWKFK